MIATNKNTILKEYFGYDKFREGQEYLIDSIMNNKNVLGVMPTGAGKSMCFQVPAMLLMGITIVISPLISLMKDQVNSLTQVGIKAAYINSSLTYNQYNKVISNAKNGLYKIIYVAPERLVADDFICFAREIDISMVTIDEAHCISQWGQDFRPSYLKIIEFIKQLTKKPIISAFTATATHQVREDIIEALELENPEILVTGFDRKNLYFEVQKPKDKFLALTQFLKNKKHKTGVIYCSTRKTVESVTLKLNKLGYNATRYHAGLSDNERKENQDDFTFDKVQIIVATNAFGMGIDKSNVSFVVHYNMPKNIESYYQEAGRAGRDGEPAECILLYSGQDVRTNMYFIENNIDVSYESKEIEYIAKERDKERLKEMTFYCYTNDCLREYILKYFGEKPNKCCDNCSSCNENFELVDITIQCQKILSCVVRSKERYGAKMITDILKGSKNEKIIKFSLDQLSTYNIMGESEKRIRDIINHLIMKAYLTSTNDEYPVLKLGPLAYDILKNKQTVKIKLVKDVEIKEKKELKQPINKKINELLFENLKKLRFTISKDQNVPAFVVFSDSSLIDMCMKLPTTEKEFLNVSGVGDSKLQKYGEKFLKEINKFLNENENLETNIESTEIKEIKESEIVIYEEMVTMSLFLDSINCNRVRKGLKKISVISVNKWLVDKGYLQTEKDNEGVNHKIPTIKGIKLGILAEDREMLNGDKYKINLYNKQAQEFLLSNLGIISKD